MAASVEPGNGFQRFGIKHLSASSINLFKNAPDVWCMQYLLKRRTSGSPAMTRGIAAEDGVVAALASELDFDDALAIAHKRFDRSYPLALDPKVSKERSDIAGYMKQAILALCDFDKPVFSKGSMDHPYPQEKILIKSQLLDGSVIDIIGYLDLIYPQHGLVFDLKTTKAVPSKMSDEHKLQAAIYAKAKGNSQVKFLYASPKKFAILENDDVAGTLRRAKHMINRMNDFLMACDTPEQAIKIVPHNPSSFYWNGDEKLREEVFNT